MLLLLSLVLLPALAAQVPWSSVSSYHGSEHRSFFLASEVVEEWSLDKFPNPNATDHLIFETVYSLLQHWPNTRMRNGHSIVPGIIPKGTLLYHGTSRKELPSGPEWVALDPEHSHIFCRHELNQPEQGCWQATLATIRPLKVVYFDGNSAAKLPYGSMDTQDLIVWGKVSRHDIDADRERIRVLCEWGKSFSVDGFVRMEMSFEVMLCGFTSGVSMVSFVNLKSSSVVKSTPPAIIAHEVIYAGSWHNHFPGETRIQLDLAGLVSFYDTQLVPSLVSVRAGQERWDHRVQYVSREDLAGLKARLEAILMRPKGVSSGIDWKTLVQVIVDRYAGRLELTRYLVDSTTMDPDEILDLANKTQTQLRTMLTPYLILSAKPTNPRSDVDLGWTIPIYNHCATTHTYSMESELESMTDSEKMLLQAVRGTTREICRVVTKMWAAGVYEGMDLWSNTKETLDLAKITRLRTSWADDLNRLMGWLDWSVWVKCNPECGSEEMCYLPTWPVGFPVEKTDPHPSDKPHPEGSDERTLNSRAGSEDWVHPQPRCIRRVAPYEPTWDPLEI